MFQNIYQENQVMIYQFHVKHIFSYLIRILKHNKQKQLDIRFFSCQLSQNNFLKKNWQFSALIRITRLFENNKYERLLIIY